MKGMSTLGMLKWSAFEQIFRLSFQVMLLVVLTKLLNPADYGIFALLSTIQVLSATFANAGLTDALIQSRNLKKEEESTLFYTSVLSAIIVSIVLLLLSPLFLDYYKGKLNQEMVYAVIFNLIVGSLGGIHFSKYTKDLDFKTPAIISIVSLFFSGVISIYMAYLGLGVWSLIYQSIINTIFTVTLVWVISGWIPVIHYKYKEIKMEIKFGINLLLARVINIITLGLIDLVIGRVYTVEALGYYNRAQYLQNTLVNGMSGIVGKVAYPKFSELSGDINRIKNSMFKVLFSTFNLSVPISIFLWTSSEYIVTIFMGGKWLESAFFLKVLSLDALIWPLQLFNVNLLMSLGRADLVLKGVIVKLIVILAFILICANNYDIKIFSIGYVISSYVNCIVNITFTGFAIKIRLIEQIKAVLPCIKAGIPMYLSILLVDALPFNNLYLRAVIILLIGLFIYIITIIKIKKIKYIEIFKLIKNNSII